MVKGIKAEWQLFINEYLASGDKIGAYLHAYPNTNRKVASNKANQLLKRPEIGKIIEERSNRKKTLINETRDAEIIQAAKTNVLSELEVDAELSKIINGTAEVEQIYIIRNSPVRIKVKPNHSEKIQAIDKYYRRHGSYAPEKHQFPPDPLAQKSTEELKTLLQQTTSMLREEDE
jgi:hypothetical protein